MVNTRVQTASEASLLSTKLFKPNWRQGLVSRPKLLNKLRNIEDCRLAIISAPAGFGKTTLLSEWVHETHSEVCWVSLNESDNDPIVFWSYVIASIQQAAPSIGDHILPSLLVPQSQPIQVITTLLNALSREENHIVLIIDDYHLIKSTAIHDVLAFFVEHSPPHVHAVLSTRTIPPLPLARLRARNELIEIEPSDLRFTSKEATFFFNETMQLQLEPDQIQILETRTEGWIAGLQLAALSVSGRTDIDAFIKDFSGDDRYIVDYLAEEVLHQHPEHIRQFLLYTSILPRFNSALCNVVTDQKESHQIIEALERANLFLVPLDNKRNWFRYHHLFGEVLQSHLLQLEPDIEPELHSRAASWFEANHNAMDAIHHALAGMHFDKAIELIEKTAITLFERGQQHTLYNLLDKLPTEFDKASPILTSWYVWRNIDRGRFDLAKEYITHLDRILSLLSPEELQKRSKENNQYKSLPGVLSTARALVSQADGDITLAITHAQQALDFLPKDETLWRGGTIAILGLASWSTGDLETAFESFHEGLYMIQSGGSIPYRISGTHVLAEIRMEQGRLNDARTLYQDALQMTEEWEGSLIRGTGDLYYGLAELAIEHNDIEQAITYFSKARSLGENATLIENVYRQYTIDARIQEAHGRTAAALDLLQEAEERFTRDAVPNPRPIPASKTRLHLALGNLDEATAWAEKRQSKPGAPLHYLIEFENIAYARILLAQYEHTRLTSILEEVMLLLQNLEQLASAGGRTWNLITIYVLQAHGLELQTRTSEAIQCLQKALNLGKPEQFFRIFLDEHHRIHGLLRHAVASDIGGAYARNLLSALEQQSQKSSHAIATQHLVQPLTKREIEIIRLIAAGMRNQEIADHLFISLSTVKRHIANAYGKLGASHRTEAINEATRLGLLSSS